MRKSELERILSREKNGDKRQKYGKYYAAIIGAFSAGNAMAYLAYGTRGLFDAFGIDFITLGFTLYEQMKIKQQNDRMDRYMEEVRDMEEGEKIGLISVGGGKNSDSKAKKIGYIAYQLLKEDLGENREIERQYGIGSEITALLEQKGYIKKGITGTKLTKKGKLAYYSIFNEISDENRKLFYVLKHLYNIPEKQILPIYQLYVQNARKENKEN